MLEHIYGARNAREPGSAVQQASGESHPPEPSGRHSIRIRAAGGRDLSTVLIAQCRLAFQASSQRLCAADPLKFCCEHQSEFAMKYPL